MLCFAAGCSRRGSRSCRNRSRRACWGAKYGRCWTRRSGSSRAEHPGEQGRQVRASECRFRGALACKAPSAPLLCYFSFMTARPSVVRLPPRRRRRLGLIVLVVLFALLLLLFSLVPLAAEWLWF